jgi:hypothetical protein
MQMCGASSKDDGIEAANYIIDYLKNIQRIMNKVYDDPQKAAETIQWLKTYSVGDYVEKPSFEIKKYENVTLQIYRPILDNAIKVPTEKLPEHLDYEIMTFFLALADDFLYHQDFCKKIDYAMRFQYIIDEPLELMHVDYAMVNYNFSLGFKVDRGLLDQYINGRDGFVSRYNNALSTSVTVELPYEPLPHRAIKTRSGKTPHHTFLIYFSGSITLSTGLGGKSMKNVYENFMKIIEELKPYIEYNPNRLNQISN